MPELDFSAGVDLDADADQNGGILDLLGKIHLGINDQAAELSKMRQQEQRRLAGLPNYISLSQANQNAVTDVIDFGGPQNGRQWELRLFTVFAVGLGTNAVVATLYVGQKYIQAPGILPTTMARWQAPSAPYMQKLSGEITINPNERLMVGLTGIVGGIGNVVVTVAFDDEIQDDARFTVAVS